MSNLDLVQQETISFNNDQIGKDLPNIDADSLNNMDIELLTAWREVFEEDRVKTHCCSGR